MKQLKYTLFIVAFFLTKNSLRADAVINLFLKPYPLFPDSTFCKAIQEPFEGKEKPLAHYCITGYQDKNIVAGIFATYGGYLSISDQLGQISFPYKHTAPKVTILITNRIVPVFMAGNTVHHWEINPGLALTPEWPATMYTMERKQDKDTKLFYWETSQAPLPENLRIPLDTIIILAKPHHIYVPIGATPTQESPHLLLPDIYVKKGINVIPQSMFMLNLKHLFGPIDYLYKKEPQRFIKHVIE